jgi:hypothetical protein
MFRLQRIFKNYAETGSFNEQVNLCGFVDSHVFLTKTGDPVSSLSSGRRLRVPDGKRSTPDKAPRIGTQAVRRKLRIYQYLQAEQREYPLQVYDRPVVDTAIKNRLTYFAAKLTRFSRFRFSTSFCLRASATHARSEDPPEFLIHPTKALSELQAQFSVRNRSSSSTARSPRGNDPAPEGRKLHSPGQRFLPVRLLDKQEAFRILKKTLNFARRRSIARLKHDTFLDYYLCDPISNATEGTSASTTTT